MEENGDVSSEAAEKEAALANGTDAMCSSMKKSLAEYDSKKEKQREYEHACKEKFQTPETIPESKEVEQNNRLDNSHQESNVSTSIEQAHRQSIIESHGKPMEEATILSYPRKITVLYELLSACLANIPEEDNKKSTKRRSGYDARHRVSLRLLATWFDVKWIKMVCLIMFCIYLVLSFCVIIFLLKKVNTNVLASLILELIPYCMYIAILRYVHLMQTTFS